MTMQWIIIRSIQHHIISYPHYQTILMGHLLNSWRSIWIKGMSPLYSIKSPLLLAKSHQYPSNPIKSDEISIKNPESHYINHHFYHQTSWKPSNRKPLRGTSFPSLSPLLPSCASGHVPQLLAAATGTTEHHLVHLCHNGSWQIFYVCSNNNHRTG